MDSYYYSFVRCSTILLEKERMNDFHQCERCRMRGASVGRRADLFRFEKGDWKFYLCRPCFAEYWLKHFELVEKFLKDREYGHGGAKI